MPVIDDYLADVRPSQRAALERVRKIVKQVVPDAGEKISYGVPTMTYKDKYILYFAAFKNHMSVFPGPTDSVKAKVDAFKAGKGTLQFTEDNPIPEDVIKTMVQDRIKNIDANN